MGNAHKQIDKQRIIRNNLYAEYKSTGGDTGGDTGCYMKILEKPQIFDRESDYWNIGGEEDINDQLVISWNLLLRQREEVILLREDKERWEKHAEEDIKMLKQLDSMQQYDMDRKRWTYLGSCATDMLH